MRGKKIVLGTRGSDLARAQTLLVEAKLREAFPAISMETRIIKTRGDKSPNEPLDSRAGRKGLFTGEIEEALRRGEIDVGVHSAKDLPSDLSPDLEICATLRRGEVADMLLMKNASNLRALPQTAKIATGSVRRRHQLLWRRSDLQILELRGNVPTRLRKFIENDWDGLVLARAGLERLGYDLSRHRLNFNGRTLHLEDLTVPDFLPAGGQGIIALELRRDDPTTRRCVEVVDHSPTFLSLTAEREFLRLLHADCNAPIGVLASIESNVMTLRAQVFAGAGEPKMAEVRSSLQKYEPQTIAKMLHAMMYGEG